MSGKKIQKEVEGWIEDIPEEVADAFLEFVEVNEKDKMIKFTIGEEEKSFSLTYPESKSDKFFLFSEDSSLSKWTQDVNEVITEKTKLDDLLHILCEKYLTGDEDGKEEDEEEDNYDMGIQSKPEAKPKKVRTKEEEEIDNQMQQGHFLDIGTPSATLRLLGDLKSIRKTKPEMLGFEADPVSYNGKKNLYHWHIKLKVVDKDSDLYKDVQKYKKNGGQDYILLEMRFSGDYPHVPPFVRVVKPRFQFRTGHVTIGGSICMQLLTKSGWAATNDIESILIQIGAELVGGGARLDSGMQNNYEYSESEAWEAFYRAAATHNWDAKGLSKDMFPKVQ